MRKVIGVWLAALLFALCLAGCGRSIAETEDGARFRKPENLSGYEFLRECKEEDVYICNIGGVTVSDFEVPSTFRGRPVIAVIGGYNDKLVTLRIGEGVQYLENIEYLNALKKLELPSTLLLLNKAFNNSRMLEEVVIPGDVKDICSSFQGCAVLERVRFTGDVGNLNKSSFRNCPRLKEVLFEGEIGGIDDYCFNECPSLVSIVLPEGTPIAEHALERATEYLPEIMSEEVIAYAEGFDADALTRQARAVLGQEFPEEKEISQSEAVALGGRLNGPIVTTEQCPDCHYSEYSPEALPEELSLRVIDVGEIEFFYRGTVCTPEKAGSVHDGTASPVFCLCELIGYSDGPEYFINTGDYYHLWYRISLWEPGGEEPIAWYTCPNGTAPFSYKLGDNIAYEMRVGESTKRFFMDGDIGGMPTPLKRVIRDFFGITGERQVEIIYR